MKSSPAALLIPLLLTLLIATSAAQTLQVVTVPADPADPTLPHAAYNGRPTTLKAVARGHSGNLYYRWDLDGDGAWDVGSRAPDFSNGNWYVGDQHDLSLVVQYPTVTANKVFVARIEATTAIGSAPSSYASFPVVCLPDFPNPSFNPDWADDADAWQLRMMEDVALAETLWELHGTLVRSGSGNSQITAYPNGAPSVEARLTAASLHLLALLDRGYLPAYPPGSYQAHGQPTPPAFAADNDVRWNTSPYAEDATRLMNFLLSNVTARSIPAADEADDGTTPLAGTNDGMGWSVYNLLKEAAPCLATAPAALAATGLEGTVAQIGSLALGKPMEVVVQQLVDGLAAAQYDANSGPYAVGAWGYSPCHDCGAPPTQAYGQHFGWAVFALHTAESRMGAAGVHVPDRVKLRLPNMLDANQHADGGPRYHTAGTYSGHSTFEPVGHFLLACRWLGWDAWDAADSTPEVYPNLTLTRGQARQIYDAYRSFVAARWTQSGSGQLSDTNTVLWGDGDYSSHVANHTWFLPMACTVRGPEGPDQWFGSHDWRREFAVDLVQQQRRSDGTWQGSYLSGHYSTSTLGTIGQTTLAAVIMAEAMETSDTTAPDLPASFAVDYGGSLNTLVWSASASPDVISYLIYRADSEPVPIDASHLVGQGEPETDWYDAAGTDAYYRLVAVDLAGNRSEAMAPTSVTGVVATDPPADGDETPRCTQLVGAFPNPFNPQTEIVFDLDRPGPARLEVCDVKGRILAVLVDGSRGAGRHKAGWSGRSADGSPAPSGIYLLRLTTTTVTETGTVMLVR